MIKINIGEAKNRLSHYLSQVESEETVIVCKRDRPIAELRRFPARRHKPRPVGLAKAMFTVPPSFFDNLPDECIAPFQDR